MRIPILLALALLLAPGLCAAQTLPTTSSSELPTQIPSFDLTALDKTADPCVDFYQ
jgi:putative endopeptidase